MDNKDKDTEFFSVRRLAVLVTAGAATPEYDGVEEFEQKVNSDFAAFQRVFEGNGIEADLAWEAENVCDRHKAEGRIAKGLQVGIHIT